MINSNTLLPDGMGETLIHKPEQVTISSDASQLGWGAAYVESRMGGVWSMEEQTLHINFLELLAATLAVKSFLKDASGVSVLLRLDNATAQGLYQQHGWYSVKLANRTGKGIMDVGSQQGYHSHGPTHPSTTVGIESQTVRTRLDETFQIIQETFGPLSMDLFASRHTRCLGYSAGGRTQKQWMQDWGPVKGFANPLIGRVLSQAHHQ